LNPKESLLDATTLVEATETLTGVAPKAGVIEKANIAAMMTKNPRLNLMIAFIVHNLRLQTPPMSRPLGDPLLLAFSEKPTWAISQLH
jgi:hypothetical protein